jgi:hypothetical protein
MNQSMEKKSGGGFAAELRLIPLWSVALGLLAFACMQWVFHIVVLSDPHPPVLGVRIFLGLLTGVLLLFYFTMAGYVNVDSGRRGMNRLGWTLLVMFVPNAIGFLIYFLMRKPLVATCPNCARVLEPGAAYCAHCGAKLKQTCVACGQELGRGAAFCIHCGKQQAAAS